MKITKQQAANEEEAGDLLCLKRSGLRWVRVGKHGLMDVRVRMGHLLVPRLRTYPAWRVLQQRDPKGKVRA